MNLFHIVQSVNFVFYITKIYAEWQFLVDYVLLLEYH